VLPTYGELGIPEFSEGDARTTIPRFTADNRVVNRSISPASTCRTGSAAVTLAVQDARFLLLELGLGQNAR
jgi:hypothetical protein